MFSVGLTINHTFPKTAVNISYVKFTLFTYDYVST